MKYTFPIIAISSDKITTRVLYSAQEVLDFVSSLPRPSRWTKTEVGAEWNVFEMQLIYRRDYNGTKNEWILRDDRGRPVDYTEFQVARNGNWKKAHRNKKREHTHRYDPVHNIRGSRAGWKINHTAKKNGGIGAEFRRETKAAYDILDLGEDENHRILKTNYVHNGWCSCCRCEGGYSSERAWKAHRRTQWR